MKNFWSALKWLCIFFAGVIAGVFSDDWVDFRASNRAKLVSEITEFNTSSQKAQSVFAQFADIASGQSTMSSDNIHVLRQALLEIRAEAEDVKTRVPSIEAQFRELESALLEVLDTATELSTADKNRPFVLAVGKLKIATDRFEQHAVDHQSSFL